MVFCHATAQGAMAYRPTAGGTTLTFRVDDGKTVDEQTGSIWRVDGWATDGSLAGTSLEPIPDAYTAFWFAWRAFHPQAVIRDGAPEG